MLHTQLNVFRISFSFSHNVMCQMTACSQCEVSYCYLISFPLLPPCILISPTLSRFSLYIFSSSFFLFLLLLLLGSRSIYYFLPVFASVCFFLFCVFVGLPVCLSIYLPVTLSVCVSACHCVCVCVPLCLSVYLCLCL